MQFDLDEIKRRLPHRDPFLWIDEVVEVSQSAIHARKHVREDLSVFAGHYPGFPVLPGVLQCEAAFQAGAVLISTLERLEAGKVPVVTRQNNTKFRNMVRPGETLDIYVELTERMANAFFLKARVKSQGKTTASLEFACAAVDAEA
jgi:3-hydroxyacyl-[acyl-carrier-protein] dehydratase